MSKHYDIAVVGSSLAAQIAAALLVKQGRRVLFLSETAMKSPTWFHSSLFLEKILGVLGGRSCFMAQRPIQIVAENSRLTVSNDISLDEELQREFGTSGPAISNWLAGLQEQGQRLEELFWENGGLPWPSFKAKARYKLLCVRNRVNQSVLERPIADQLSDFADPPREFLTDLLQGLALTPVDNLSTTRAAILWAQAQRPENVKGAEFSQTLEKRFNQFHGARDQVENLQPFEFDGSRWTGGQLASGGRFSADNFLLGDLRQAGLFAAVESLKIPSSPVRAAWQTDNLAGQLSMLLGTRVICGGRLPLRMAIEQADEQLHGLIHSTENATDDEIRRQLGPVLPFAKYRLDVLGREQVPTPQAKRQESMPLASLPLRAASNLYWADNTVLLPEMDGAGAALLAWTIVANLRRQPKAGLG
jgi:hypothetical protein